jgi:hypothetical protein
MFIDEARRLFATWAPSESIWTQWAKPVLFTYLKSLTRSPMPSIPDLDFTGIPDAYSGTAIVVNLPGGHSVLTGVAFAQRGFRPVPLFNSSDGNDAVLKVDDIVTLLDAAASTMETIHLASDAPPAFLIDSQRATGVPLPGQFDNRWVVFPQDFPSATFLRSENINRVIVFSKKDTPLGNDLLEVLMLWHKGKLEILSKDPFDSEPPQPVSLGTIRRWRMWSALALVALFGVKRNFAGGFGAVIPTPSTGGG